MDEIGTVHQSGLPDRRSVLRKAGLVGAGIWAAPVVTSFTSPAFAQGSPDSGGGDDNSLCPITVDVAGTTVTATVETAGACNTLQFGVDPLGLVCDDCVDQSGAQRTATFNGTFPVGYALTPYMLDRGNLHGSCCSSSDCNTRFDCTDSQHTFVVKLGPNDYRVYFVDAGCNCAGNSTQAGPGASNLTARVTIS